MSFTDLNLHPNLVRAATGLGYTAPTPIQHRAIPAARDGRDVLACAATGSGKTAAFKLPILHRLAARKRGVRALILAPPRELAAQIDEQRVALGRHTDLTGAAVFGGVGMGPQETAFRRGVDIIVATPGRLLDHLGRGYVNFDGVEIVVLDEADRMLDMGFLPDVRRIFATLPKRPRQTLLFSATMPAEIVQLAAVLLRDPVRVDVERPPAPAAGVRHGVYSVSRDGKLPLLLDILRQPDVRNVLAFTRTKHRADRLAGALVRSGVSADRIHGNRSQSQRTKALASFKTGSLRVLVATDIAARGIDVAGLSHVVNFDVPNEPDSYIHRVGRTGRVEAVGDAVTFVSPEEESDFRSIERAVRRPIVRLPMPASAR